MPLAPFERLLPPTPGLQAAVRGIWCMSEPHAAGPDEQIVPPDDRVEVVFHSGDAWIHDGDGREPLPRVFIGGLRTRPVRVVSSGPTHMVSAWLHPWAAAAILGHGRPVLGIHREVGPELRALSSELCPLLSRGELGPAAERLERWIARRALAMTRAPRDAPKGWRAGVLVWESHGKAPLAALAAREACSLRQLERRFQQVIGLSPRSLGRLVRFARAADRLDAEPKSHLVALALDQGYADQAHLTREFRLFAGMTPGRYARDRAFPDGHASTG